MEKIVALCKRRGFIFPSYDIYGGLQGFYDYGPMGVELKKHLKDAWWRAMVYDRDDVEGIDTAIITNRKVLQHSGHEATFTDPLVDCRACQSRWREDMLTDHVCPQCGSKDLTDARPFNLMFKTHTGPVENEGDLVYLRPETAQGIFINFKHVLDAAAPKMPFGIAQIGKAFRNEITPRNFIFRVREFEQMELEFFVKPGEDETWHRYWVDARVRWWQEQGLTTKNLECYTQLPHELAHYAKATVDILYRFPHGLEELEGVANRTDFDLGSHTKAQAEFQIKARVEPNQDSCSKLAVHELDSKLWYIPFVIEPSAGLDRGVLAVLTEAYTEETLDNGEQRVVLKLKPHLAPVKVAVIPLARNKSEIVAYATKVQASLKNKLGGRVVLENTGNIGKAYRRHDEIGTPYCVTIDFETLEHHTVTVRDRDTLKQDRVSVDQLLTYLLARMA